MSDQCWTKTKWLASQNMLKYMLWQIPVLELSLQHILANDILKGEGAYHTCCLTLDEHLELSTILHPALPLHTGQLCNLIVPHLTALISKQSTIKEWLQGQLLSIEIPCSAIYTLFRVRGIMPFSTHLQNRVHHLRFLLPAFCFAFDNRPANWSWQLRVEAHCLFNLVQCISPAFLLPHPTACRYALTTMHLLCSGKLMRSSVAGHDCPVIDNETDNTNTRQDENANHLELLLTLCPSYCDTTTLSCGIQLRRE